METGVLQNSLTTGISLKDYFLSEYSTASFIVKQKAYTMMWTCLLFIVLISAAIISHIIFPRNNSIMMHGINTSIITVTISALYILKKGKYNLSTYFLIIPITIVWGIGCFLKLEGYLENGINSYLYLIFAVIAAASFFGNRKLIQVITVIMLIINTAFLLFAIDYSTPEIKTAIINSSINIYIGIVLTYIFSSLITRITMRSLRITEEELQKNKELNQNLEIKVEERSIEIKEAMIDLEKKNSILADTQSIMQKDMDMAANVQQTFLYNSPPEVNNWDISFLYKPHSSISGDFYDFYVENNELKGCCLFDVSGHGVASGLITLLAKSIIFRRFNQHPDNPGSIMNLANKDLAKELANVDNYLTGILLRISGNKIEYINAAHPDLFIKRAKNNEVIELGDKSHNSHGPFIGIMDQDFKYPALQFKMNPGDSILIFSDGLSECTVDNKELYGDNLLIEAFRNISPEAHSSEIISEIIYNCDKYKIHENYKDDLTAIVLRYTG